MSRLLPSRFLLPSRRLFTSSSQRGAFAKGPSPPRLPPKEQEEFERLQRASTGAFSTPRGESAAGSKISQFADSLSSGASINQASNEPEIAEEAAAKEEQLHPDYRKGAKPEFEGDVNPKTGEVGGPKNNPLRWGGKSDWSYNGRVTDF